MIDTFKAFITFVSEDSIMLGLCIAILVLIVMFILVLVLGKKKETKKEKALDNTDELLKTEINMDALKSTTELKLDGLTNETFDSNVENASDDKIKVSEIATEIPVTTEEPVKIEFEDKPEEVFAELSSNENVNNNIETLEESNLVPDSIPSFEDLKITSEDDKKENVFLETVDNTLEDTNINLEDLNNENVNIFESATSPVEEIETVDNSLIIPNEDENMLDNISVVESNVEPLEETEVVENVDSKLELEENPVVMDFPIIEPNSIETKEDENNIFDVSTLPVVEENNTENENVVVEAPLDEVLSENENVVVKAEVNPTVDSNLENIPVVENPIEEVKLEDNILPKEEEDDIELPDYSDLYSVDDIELPNINLSEFNKTTFGDNSNDIDDELPKKIEDQDDDLDLPKLNSNPSNTLNSLKGESFKIDK